MTSGIHFRPAFSAGVRRGVIGGACALLLALSGCSREGDAPAAPTTDATAPAGTTALPVAAPAYTPPTADQLYDMVAPIALYPDKLVAQVLAGATYPDQISAADAWLQQNETLKAGPLADAANQQPWDPSVKSLTAFRPVVQQMASNLPWTTALGQAYYNDPDDVLNAVQVMRQRAEKAGQLKSTPQQRVGNAAPPPSYTPDPNAQAYYTGQAIVEPPAQLITIEPAQPDLVYVPRYDPQVVYGQPVAPFAGYAYAPPAYSGAQVAVVGALGFGAGVVVGSALQRHDWGWNAWDMNWGRPDAYRGRPREANFTRDRPAVVYNRSTYISRSDSVARHPGRGDAGDARRMEALQAQQRQQQAQIERQQQQQLQQQRQLQQAQQDQQRRQDDRTRERERDQRQAQQADARNQQQQQRAQQEQAQRQQQAQQAQERNQQQQQRAQQEQAQRQQQAQQAQQRDQQQRQRAQQDQAQRQQQAQQAQERSQQQQQRAQQEQAQRQQQAQQARQRDQQQRQRVQQDQAQRQQQAQQAQVRSQQEQQRAQQEQSRRQQQAQQAQARNQQQQQQAQEQARRQQQDQQRQQQAQQEQARHQQQAQQEQARRQQQQQLRQQRQQQQQEQHAQRQQQQQQQQQLQQQLQQEEQARRQRRQQN